MGHSVQKAIKSADKKQSASIQLNAACCRRRIQTTDRVCDLPLKISYFDRKNSGT